MVGVGSGRILNSSKLLYMLSLPASMKRTRSKTAEAAPVAEWVRSLYFSAINDSIISPLCLVSGVGSSPALATCETSQVLLAGVSGVSD